MDNLEWRWTDLKVGDKLKLTREAVKHFNKLYGNDWKNQWINYSGVIEDVSISMFTITLHLTNIYSQAIYFYMDFYGMYERFKIFDIVELTKD